MPGKLPKLCHFKPRDLACVWINPTRRLYLGPWGSPESHERYAEVIRQLLAGNEVTEAPTLDKPSRPPTLTISDLVPRYQAYARGYYVKNGEPTTEYAKVSGATELAAEHYGNLPAAEFGPLCLRDVRDRLVAKGLARTTVNSQVRRIVVMFKWAVASELIEPSVYEKLKAVSGLRAGRTAARETAPVMPVADDVVDATLPELPEVVADMVRLQRLTGMRPGEVFSLRPCDLDLAGDVWTYRPASHKTEHHGKSRVVFVGPKAQAVLLRYLARDAQACCFRPCDSEAKRRAEQHAARQTPLSCGNRPGTNRAASPLRKAGERYTKDSYGNAIRRAAKRAGIEHWTPNQLRHSAATSVRADYGLEGAQVILGHSTARTSEIYAEKNLAAGAEIARQIG